MHMICRVAHTHMCTIKRGWSALQLKVAQQYHDRTYCWIAQFSSAHEKIFCAKKNNNIKTCRTRTSFLAKFMTHKVQQSNARTCGTKHHARALNIYLFVPTRNSLIVQKCSDTLHNAYFLLPSCCLPSSAFKWGASKKHTALKVERLLLRFYCSGKLNDFWRAKRRKQKEEMRRNGVKVKRFKIFLCLNIAFSCSYFFWGRRDVVRREMCCVTGGQWMVKFGVFLIIKKLRNKLR